MQHMESSYSTGNRLGDKTVDDNYTLAIVAECLFLINLLFFPGLAFIVLSLVYLMNRQHPSAVVRCHLKQTVVASMWAGVMIVIVSIAMVLIGGLGEPGSWIIGIIYFLSIHGTLVLMGGMGLSRAINNKHFHYPLIGPRCSDPNSSNPA